jgi:uncharacterized protein (TIGR00369 family)
MSETPEKPWMKTMRAMLAGEMEPPPIAKLIGFRLIDCGEGTATFALTGDPQRHANPMGTMHGGVLVDIGDAAMGFAMASTLDEGESFTTVELKANYFKPVFRQELRAEARMIKRSRTLGYLECDIKDETGALVCRLGSTCMVLRGQAASGR